MKRWRLLDHDFRQDAGEITPTAKVRRMIIKERYAKEIEALYR